MDEIIRVLLIENDEAFWKPMMIYLIEEGFKVEVAASGQEAMAKVQACEGNFHVAVIGMPDSTEIMLQLHRSYPTIEIIILADQENIGPGGKAQELDAWFMQKPINSDDLALDIRHAVRYSQERRKSSALQALVSAGERLSASQNEEDLYLRLYEEAQKLLPRLDGFLITHYNEQEQEVSFPFGYRQGKRVTVPSRKNGNNITEFVLRSKEPLLLQDGDRAFREKEQLDMPDPSLDYCLSEAAAPMFLNGQIVGTINALTYEHDVHYTQEHLQILQAFANQAAMAIRTVQQLNEAKQLRNAAMVLAGKRGKEEVLKAIVEEAHKLIGADYTGLILQEGDGTLHKVKPVIPEVHYDHFDEPRQQGGVTRLVVESRQPRMIRDTCQDSLVKENVRAFGIRSILAIPLIHADRVLGVLYAHTFSLRSFDSHDVDLCTAFATQAAATLNNTLEEERYIQDYLRLANELGKLNEKVEFYETLTRVATAGKAVFESDTCRIAFVNPHTGQIVDWAWASGDPEQYRYESEPRPDGTTNYVLRTKEPIFRSVVESDDPLTIPELVSRGLQSYASLPLIYSGRTIGILHCNYLTRHRPFNEHQRTVMDAFCARAAIALSRAHHDKINVSLHSMDNQSVISQDYLISYGLFVQVARSTYDASFAAFYPSRSITISGKSTPTKVEIISVGEPPMDWNVSNYWYRDDLIRELGQTQDDLLIINDLESTLEKAYLNLKKMRTIKAFVAVRFNATTQEGNSAQQGGLLILTYKNKTLFESSDLDGLRYAGNQLEARILKRNLQIALQEEAIRRNQQFRSIIHTLKAFLQNGKGLSLDFIAERSLEILDIDNCVLIEYDPVKMRFVQRGTAGLKYPDAPYTIPDDAFRERFIDSLEIIEIKDVLQDELTRTSYYVKREGIKSVVIFPLRFEGEFLGLFFANFRRPKDFSIDEKETIELFADLATLVLYESHLGKELSETQKRLDRHLILVWVSMLETTWRHSIVQKAAAIRNYGAVLLKRLDLLSEAHPVFSDFPTAIENIDRLANDIANAPPRVPQSWEMEAESIPLASLLKELADREGKTASLQTMQSIKIISEVDALEHVMVSGYRRWLIYALEALLQNARNAMPRGGDITITGLKKGKWAEIRIKDTGIGVPATIRKTLFKDVTPKDQDASGMGIGGLLVSTIVEEHRGTIELERPGPGDTTVLIRLPVFEDHQS